MNRPLVGLAALVVAGAVVGGIELADAGSSSGGANIAVTATAPTAAPPQAVSSAFASAAPSPVQSVTAIRADYLPTGAVRIDGGSLRGQQYQSFSLPGRANSSTVPAGGLTADDATTAHVAARLILTATPGYTALPDQLLAGFGGGFAQRWTTVRGTKALVTQQENGYGTLRIDWIGSDNVYYTALTQRLDTVDGLSGIDEATLGRVANGVSAS